MAINIDKAFEVTDGVLVNEDSNGNYIEGPFYTGGPNSPIGLNLPEKTFYVQNSATGIKIWIKFSNGVNDWRQLSAQDIPFDSSLIDLSSTDAQGAIEELANRHFGKDYVKDSTEFNDSTTGNSFKTYASFNFNVDDDSGINSYRVMSNFFWNHNSASNDIRVRLMVDGSEIYEIRVESKDPGTDQRIPGVIAGAVSNLSQGSHSVELQYRPATSSRVSRMYKSFSEIWRVE